MVAPGVAPIESMTVDKPAKQPGVPPKRTQVPENAESMHPTTLLCMVSLKKFRYFGDKDKTQLIYLFISIMFTFRCDLQLNMLIWVAKDKFQIFNIVSVLKLTKIISLDLPEIRNWHENWQRLKHATNFLERISLKMKPTKYTTYFV